MVSMKASLAFLWLLLASNRFCVQSFRPDWSNHQTRLSGSCVFSAKNIDRPNTTDNKAMAFLRRMGRVGGNRDFTHAIGIDEGPSTKSTGSGKKKKKAAFQSCALTGVIDDLSEPFPTTSSGTQWAGYTDQVMGGVSTGHLCREDFDGRTSNVLRGKVSLRNNGGFIQMATNLAHDAKDSRLVDASSFDGIEVDVQYQGEQEEETFNIHLKNVCCPLPYSSYRARFSVPKGSWMTARVPWTDFRGHGPGASDIPFSSNSLTRAGIVAIGKEMEVLLAVSGLRFYREKN
ncbi:predicted protein [Phaeodactylum tricornutum CCAP 1055/1]|jgi:hypothetical protein|uniref:NADH:ubiquinone oxidoreductase intermediate-associated protein 30 domain-containing protein n=2 Tax=Phaeodactylum tricornutum TaxID=2850 RepID=B7G2F6_PHATC|nr:predicted protein [Phaeodactylum tricornutum CCAP 1055/1]EEC47123.1 predicted protein [Phaeodactylum tricornutum CCAP 1055/1]|eukprot:XP_002181200.1 predicted protein [Phaeodactylum tricornutum CCAP 1055/1]